jgi:hypothetical protein
VNDKSSGSINAGEYIGLGALAGVIAAVLNYVFGKIEDATGVEIPGLGR